MMLTISAPLLNLVSGVLNSTIAVRKNSVLSAVFAVLNWFFVGALLMVILKEVTA